MKQIIKRIQKAFAIHIVSKRFKIEFLMDGNLEPLHTTYLEGKNKNDVEKRFNRLDLESRRDIVSVNVC
jgi:hypothetical protein